MTRDEIKNHPLGIVPERFVHFHDFALDCGATLKDVTLCYEMYGTLSEKKDNAILIIHALSGSAHAAGFHSENDAKPGWWDTMIGPDLAFDTNRYCIIVPNSLGSCYGSTGPTTLNPDTGKLWGPDFPGITIQDMTRANRELMRQLDIPQWACVAGGSMGGMQVFQWAIMFPKCVRCILPIATTYRTTPEMIAFNYVARRAIMDDPAFLNGHYDLKNQPTHGLSIARMLGHISYLCETAFENKFGRALRPNIEKKSYNPRNNEFDVEGYLDYQAKQFVGRFDANTYLLIARAIDYYDTTENFDGDIIPALAQVKVPTQFISFDSDWIYTPELHQRMADAIAATGTPVRNHVIPSPCGHDAFLIEYEAETPIVQKFLDDYAASNSSR